MTKRQTSRGDTVRTVGDRHRRAAFRDESRSLCPPGSGPARAGILLAVTDEATAERFCQRFKREVFAPIESDRWALDASDVLGWLKLASGTDDVVRLVVET